MVRLGCHGSLESRILGGAGSVSEQRGTLWAARAQDPAGRVRLSPGQVVGSPVEQKEVAKALNEREDVVVSLECSGALVLGGS